MNQRSDWNDLLRNCDFKMTAREVRDMLKTWKEEAASSGQEPFYNPEFLAVLYPFLKTPSVDTAISLLEVAPATYSVFEGCSPGGNFYEMNHLLKRDNTTPAGFEPEEASQSESKREPTYEELMARLRELEREANSMGIELSSRTGQLSSTSSELKAAFLDSARPDAPAPPGWWILPVIGIVGSLFLLKFNITLGTICLVLTSSFFGFCLLRAKRNRTRRTPVA